MRGAETLSVVEAAAWIVALGAVVTVASLLSRRLPLPAPLVLTIVGLVASFVPGVPQVHLRPTVVLVGFLPPLLYAAALRTSLLDFRRNRRPIGLLSVGLVVVTTLVAGLVTWWLLPVPLPAALALGAVVAPPDAVAATAIARRVGMPRRMVTILEGEGLVNDATALVALRTAVAAIGGSVSLWRIGGDFVLAAVVGVVVGLVVAFVTGKVRSHISDEITETSVSMITPFVSYLLAEAAHGSGVLAVVVTGLVLSHRSQLKQSASSRIFERMNWATIQFLLENAVFLLIGLQVRQIVTAAAHSDLPTSQIVLACVGVTAAVVVVRPLWVFPATYLPRLIPAVRAIDPMPPPSYPAAISWAGMRGVVTLAAAFVIPVGTPNREVLILLALVVVGATLLLQGATLPWVLCHLGLSGPDPAEDALQVASVNQRVATAGLARLEAVAAGERDDVVDRLRQRSAERAQALWERLGGTDETPSQAYVRLRLQMIDAERTELVRIRDLGVVPHEVLGQVLGAVDIEETVLDLREGVDAAGREEDLVAPRAHEGCAHMEATGPTPTPRTPAGCEECLAIGQDWVHLRLCLSCGHVGCCDSSIGRHATGHFDTVGHPVIRSFEPGEAWRWCYVDEVLG